MKLTMATEMGLAAIVVAAFCLLQAANAQTTHVVGDGYGWKTPSDNPGFYALWAASRTFIVGDILLFNFTTGDDDVAKVTAESFLICNSTDPITKSTTGPANFTLDSEGFHYFISTFDSNCIKGQKLLVNVTSPPGPSPPPSTRGPVNYTVGDGSGWAIPHDRPLSYADWAFNKTFLVGDTLVFNFNESTDDVAVVTREGYLICNVTSPLELYNSTPTYITLKSIGEKFYVSTRDNCIRGQRLGFNVTGYSVATPPTTSPPSSSPSPTKSPSNTISPSSHESAPSPASSAPIKMNGVYISTLAFVVVMALISEVASRSHYGIDLF